jgi:6-pyruvoyltetrahydropterin/6-carboxytetrahydropterin synthase
MSDGENQETYGKCNNPHGHGHNYSVEVTMSGQVEPGTGMICNLQDLDAFVDENILQRFDIQNLNLMPEFAGVVPTTENLCIALYDILQRGSNHAHLERVRIEETMKNSFEYAGGAEIRP